MDVGRMRCYCCCIIIEVALQCLFRFGRHVTLYGVVLPRVTGLVYRSGLAINVPDVYQESVLHPYRTYSDVSIFHYYVPSQVTKAVWEFAAFMDDPDCTPRQVHIVIQPGSYPVINADNSSWPVGTYVDADQRYTVSTVTKFQSHDALVFHVFNPSPGSWFAVAYVPDWNLDIGQQGLSHKCRYSLGSIATWKQQLDVTLITPHVPTTIESSAQDTFIKFYVPDNIWKLEVTVSNCTVRALATYEGDFCAQGFGIEADSLPFVADVNITFDGIFRRNVSQPQTDTYYYIVVSAIAEISFTITVSVRECVYVWGSSPFQDPMAIAPTLLSSSSSLGTAAAEVDDPPTTTSTSTSVAASSTLSLPRSALSSRHSNQSVSQDWKDAIHVLANRSHVVNQTLSSNALLRSADAGNGNYADDHATLEQERLPIVTMARIKHSQDFMVSFLLQGKDRYTPFLGVSDAFPVILKLTLVPFVDIGGTLQIGAQLIEPPINALDQFAVLRICISHGRPPRYDGGRIVCRPHMDMTLNTSSSSDPSAIKYFPFPRPGQWFIAFETRCHYANVTATSSGNETEVPCHFDLLMVYLNARVQMCFFEGASCGLHGICTEDHRGQFFFSTCRCVGGWRGWGCTDGSQAVSTAVFLAKTLLLTLSNIFFVPAVLLAMKRRFYAESLVYTSTMFFSTLYHACDTDLLMCPMRYEVLQFCDFFSAILSFWVTLILMADLPMRIVSVAHMIGALGIAFGVQYQRTGLWVFAVPSGTGVLVLIVAWSKRCRYSKSCYPSRIIWLVSFLPGTLLATVGLCLFAFLETEGNYEYVHSLWHVMIALSIVFLLPDTRSIDQPSSSLSTSSSSTHHRRLSDDDGEQRLQQHDRNRSSRQLWRGLVATNDSELLEVGDYSAATSDSHRLVN